MTRRAAFAAMERGSLPDVCLSSIYGIPIDTMNEEELRIALGWAISQTARLLGPERIGVMKETKQ